MEASFDRGVLLQLRAEQLLPVSVPLGYVAIVGRRVEPNTKHVQPLGKERLLEHVNESGLGKKVVPVHDPVPRFHALFVWVDEKLGVEDHCQFGHHIALQEHVPAGRGEDWRLPGTEHGFSRRIGRVPMSERVRKFETNLRKERRLETIFEQWQPRVNPCVDLNAIG